MSNFIETSIIISMIEPLSALSFCHGITATYPNTEKAVPPQEWVGFFSLISQQWSTKTVIAGYKGTLTAESVQEKLRKFCYFNLILTFWTLVIFNFKKPLKYDYLTENNSPIFFENWNKDVKYPVVKCLLKSFGKPYLLISLINLCGQVIKFFTPKLLKGRNNEIMLRIDLDNFQDQFWKHH